MTKDIVVYVESIIKGEIPDRVPYNIDWCCTSSGMLDPRRECNKRGLWPMVDKEFYQEVAEYIKGKSVLEVMAGAGFHGKGLSEQGIEIICTDDFSWDTTHTEMTLVYPVFNIDAISAINQYKDADILLISWPPYGDETIIKVCSNWNKPIIYIGEPIGGCNAPHEFFNHFNEGYSFYINQWCGLHDQALYGYYKQNNN
jgi:hypothetical protein